MITIFAATICFILNCFVIIFILRIWFQAVGADFFNPVSRFIHVATKHPIFLLGNRSFKNINLSAVASLIVLIIIKYILVYFIFLDIPTDEVLAHAEYFLKPLLLIIKLSGYAFCFVLLIDALLSWFQGNPAVGTYMMLTSSLVNPILNEVRRIIPRIGMIDVSSLIVLLLLTIADHFITQFFINVYGNFGVFLWYSILL